MDDPNLIPATPEGDALEEQISRSLVDSLSDDAPGAPDDAEDVLAALDGTLTDLPETNKINETDAPADGEPEQDAAQAVETVDETAEAPSEPPQEDAAEPLGEEEKENEKEEPAAVPAANPCARNSRPRRARPRCHTSDQSAISFPDRSFSRRGRQSCG